MSRTRLLVGVSIGAAVLLVAALAGGATAKTAPTATGSSAKVVKLGFITKFPVGFFFTLQNAAKKWDKQHPGAKVVFAQGKSATDDAGEIAAIQDMVAGGVKGIAITPTSPAVVPALVKAQKQGVKIILMDNDIPAWKGKSSVVATNNFKGGSLAGKYLAKHLKAGDKLGVLAGVPGVPALDARVNGMLAGLGSLRSQVKVVGKLQTDCAQAGKHQSEGHLDGRLRCTAGRGRRDQGGERGCERRPVPGEDRPARDRYALEGRQPQEGQEERRYGYRARNRGERREVRRLIV
jgi:ABC-type sugar transport system substrate-binding protein